MRVGITGATGFIGKLLVEKHISLGSQVSILSRSEKKQNLFNGQVKYFIGDLLNKESLTLFIESIDILYHCAAEIKDESAMRLTNVEGTKNLIDVASNKIYHWIQLSSTGVYGPIKNGVVVENQNYNPQNEYEKTKLESDLLVIDAAHNNKFFYTIMRPTNVFGTQMINTSLFQLIKAIDKGVFFFIGPRGASANYVPVENVVEALMLAACKRKKQNQVYIISDWCSIDDFVHSISIKLGKSPNNIRPSIGFMKFLARLSSFISGNPLTITRVDALSSRSIYCIKKIEKDLNYKPIISVNDAIQKLVIFYLNSNR